MKTACGPDQVKFSVKSVGLEPNLAQPDSGKALVYVIEEFDHAPNEIGRPTVRVGLDGVWTGANRGTSHFSFPVDPGERHFCVDWQSRPFWLANTSPMIAASSLTAAAGQTYYLRARIVQNSSSVWTLDFELVNPDEGRVLVAHSPRAEFHPKK